MATQQILTGTMAKSTTQGSVLVVDDDAQLAETYARMLEDSHVVRTATAGWDAIERIGDDVDVVLLDRQMPGTSGSEILSAIREAGYDCRVAMVTAMEPDVDVIEMPFDDYVVKPVDARTLRSLVDTLMLRSRYDEGVQELLALTSKLVTLETRLDDYELADHEEYQELRDRRGRLQRTNQERLEALAESEDPEVVFRDVLGPTEEPG